MRSSESDSNRNASSARKSSNLSMLSPPFRLESPQHVSHQINPPGFAFARQSKSSQGVHPNPTASEPQPPRNRNELRAAGTERGGCPPTHGDLDHAVQLAKREIGWHENPAPDDRAEPQQPNLKLHDDAGRLRRGCGRKGRPSRQRVSPAPRFARYYRGKPTQSGAHPTLPHGLPLGLFHWPLW